MRRIFWLSCLTAAVLAMPCTSLGQVQTPPIVKSPRESDDLKLQVVHLKYARSSDVAKLLKDSLGIQYASSDALTNSVIIRATNAQLDLAKALLEKIDVSQAAEARQPNRRGLQVIQLKNARARDVARIFNETLGISCSFDERINSVIFRPTPEQLDSVKELLAKIDVPQISESTRQLRVFPLAKSGADSSLQQALGQILANRSDKFTIDSARQQLILYASEDAAKLTAELLQQLAAKQPRIAPSVTKRDLTIRVVCLMDSPRAAAENAKGESKLTEDFTDVRATLARFGIANPGLFGQLVIRTIGNEFSAQGLMGGDSAVKINGRLDFRDDGPPRLFINISSARRGKQNDSAEQTSGADSDKIQTEITAPPGQMILLGVTPHDRMSKVYLVQVIANPSK